MFRALIHSLTTKAVTRVVSGAVAVAFAATVVAPVVPHASAALTTGARISFTFDDGHQSAYTLAAPTLAKYGYSGTSYVISSCIGMVTIPNTCRAETNRAYMTWAQVTDLKNTYKWEIGSHTETHPLLVSTDADEQPTALTNAQVIAELTNSKNAIKTNTGIDVQAFADPYGDWNPGSLTEIAKLYSSHRGFADLGYNGFPYNDYLLYTQQVQVGSTDVPVAPLATVKGYIDTAKANNQWLVLTFHDILAAGGSDYDYSVADLDAIAAYVKSLNIPVVNVSDGLISGNNLLSNGGFDTALSADIANATVWSTDDMTNIRQDTGNHGSYPNATNSVILNSTTKNIELFSPRVAVTSTDKYIIKTYLNVETVTVATGNEVAFYIDEYDAAGTYIGTVYKKSETSRWVANLNFEYVPSAATVKAARLQVVVTANSGIKAYMDNVQWLSESGTPGGSGGGQKAGDVNGDTVINVLDLSVIASNWQRTGATWAQGDLNADGTVNVLDLSILASNWGK